MIHPPPSDRSQEGLCGNGGSIGTEQQRKKDTVTTNPHPCDSGLHPPLSISTAHLGYQMHIHSHAVLRCWREVEASVDMRWLYTNYANSGRDCFAPEKIDTRNGNACSAPWSGQKQQSRTADLCPIAALSARYSSERCPSARMCWVALIVSNRL